jgi:WD40 repeat protein
MLRKLLLCFVLLICAVSTHAQENNPVITPTNASQLTEVRRIGGTLPGDLAWSPDGTKLAVGTSDGVYVYNNDFAQTPLLIQEGGMDASFTEDGILLSNGQYWDVETGQSLPKPESAPISKRYTVDVVDENGQATVTLTNKETTEATRFTLEKEWMYSGISFSNDEQLIAIWMSARDTNQNPVRRIEIHSLTPDTHKVSTLEMNGVFYDRVIFGENKRTLLVVFSDLDDTFYGEGVPDSQFYLWDITQGRLITEWFSQNVIPYLTSPDNTVIAFENAIWNGYDSISLQSQVRQICCYKSGFIFDADGEILAVNTDTNQIHIYTIYLFSETVPKSLNARIKSIVNLPIELSNPFSRHLFLSNDGQRLIVQTEEKETYLYDTATGEMVVQVPFEGVLDEAEFSPDNQYMLIRDHVDAKINMWNANFGVIAYTLPAEAAVHPDWSKAVYWKEGKLQILDIATGATSSVSVVTDYHGTAWAWNETADLAIFAGQGNLRFYKFSTGELLETVPYPGRVDQVEFTMDGQRFFVHTYPLVWGQGQSGIVQVWSINDLNKPHGTIELVEYRHEVRFSPDGMYIAFSPSFAGGVPGEVFIYDANTVKELAHWYIYDFGVDQLSFTLDSQMIATVSATEEIKLWDIESTIAHAALVALEGVERFSAHFPISPSRFTTLSFSPLGSWLILGSDEGVTGFDIRLLPQQGSISVAPYGSWSRLKFSFDSVTAPLFDPTESVLIAQTKDAETLQLWDDLEAWNSKNTFSGTSIATFSPDSQLLATSVEDGILIYSVEALKVGVKIPIVKLPNAEMPIKELAFSDDGRELYVRDDSGVSVWGIGE